MFRSARVMSVSFLIALALGSRPAAHARVKVKDSDPDFQGLQDLTPSPEEAASLVVVGRVEKVDLEEYDATARPNGALQM